MYIFMIHMYASSQISSLSFTINTMLFKNKPQSEHLYYNFFKLLQKYYRKPMRANFHLIPSTTLTLLEES